MTPSQRISGNIYGLTDLEREIERFPPDPNSAARHRAETLVKTDTLRVVLLTMLSRAILREHAAPGPLTVQVLRGAVKFTVDDEPYDLQAGQLIAVAPDKDYAVEGIEDGAFLLTIAFLSRAPDPGGSGARGS